MAGGAEVCLIPEIPYDLDKVQQRLEERYVNGRGFAHIVVAEGASPKDGDVSIQGEGGAGYENRRLGGIAYQIAHDLKARGFKHDIRETVLGHTQRGGTPIAFDRILATLFGVKAAEMVIHGEYGRMVVSKNNEITSVPLLEAIQAYNVVKTDSFIVNAARKMGISFGD